MQAAQRRQRVWYDRRARERTLEIGQKVLVLEPTRQNKFQAAWQGPYQVVGKIADTTYIVADCDDPRVIRIFHVNMLKPYRERPEERTEIRKCPQRSFSALRSCAEILWNMKTLLWLLSAVLSSQCVTSQISMVESGPGVVRPSETLDLTCKVTGASLTDSTNMHCVQWIRQPEGKGLEWLGHICYDNSKYYAQSVQGRMTLSRDTNKGEVYCKLTGVNPEESGTYYCARHSQFNIFYYFAGVTSQVSMVESGPGVVRPSETLDLTCKVTGASLTDRTIV
ncbi:unnamed protein product [Ranitomeya imitator]|uniref:Ig-like domain-containing protein n=1 Tax=Ranitomeya imitator TaxID=111125 RepID=A0ABN9KMD3_9NEOB|nr:unnamed protein product [Ranitomeya imitator]